MGRYEGTPEKISDVEALIRLYRKYQDLWQKTYGDRVSKLLKIVWILSGKGKILILGAGTPTRFPEELDKYMTAVDRDPRIKKIWKEEGRKAAFVIGDVAEKAQELMEKHDIIVLPAIISWLPKEKRLQLKDVLQNARAKGKTILAYDTTHMSS
jgi:hypothetical protein